MQDKLDFPYIDNDIIVFNKPAGMPSTSRSSWQVDEVKNTAEGIVKSHYQEARLCHRLDNDTSGLLLFARGENAYQRFREYFSDNSVAKIYLAIVVGSIHRSWVCNFPIAHHSKNKRKMMAVTSPHLSYRGDPRSASTIITPLETNSNASLVKVEMKGGRRHQIRIHLAAEGYPLIGDALYKGVKAHILQGQALHSWQLQIPHKSLISVAPSIDFINECISWGLKLGKHENMFAKN